MEFWKGSLEGLVMNENFWRGKRVLITGHTGFKGSWLSLWLRTKGSEIIGYSLAPPSQPNMFEAANVSNEMTCIMGDIRDLEHLKAVVRKHKPEIIIHMAAQALVRYSYQEPIETYSTNVLGTANTLEAARKADCVRVVLIITSDKCYANKEQFWGYREKDPLGGHDPYSSSKACAELITSAYRRSYFFIPDNPGGSVSIASARAGNVIGGGDWGRDRLVPDIIRAITENRPVVIRNPDAVRPWQHVLEPLSGYLELVKRLWEDGPNYAESWNFGPTDDDCMPVSWIVTKLTSLWGDECSWKLDYAQNPNEARILKLDWTKAKIRLGWSPRLNLTTSLEWLVQWYREYLNNGDMREFTEKQISRYENLGLR